MEYQFAAEGSDLEHKLQLYTAAASLFNAGKSHPQIVELLQKHETDTSYLTRIVDKAQYEVYTNLFEYCRQLFEEGKTYDEVITLMKLKENDEELVLFFCNKWYEWKTELLEHAPEAHKNIRNGLIASIGCGIIVTLMFYYGWSWIGKTMWILGFVASLAQMFVGFMQKRASKSIIDLLETKIIT